jgi:Endonuclease/Exonuclease/phosphatase family
MSSLRIGSYNTQLRSWAMQVGASDGWTLPPINTVEERAKIIAHNILASPFDYDIIGLSEVFHEDARDILRDELRSRFPFIITQVDYDHVKHETGDGSGDENVLPLLAAWRLIGLPGGSITSNWRAEDGGLMVFSRFPFATMSSAALDPAIVALLQTTGMPVAATIPVANFLPYVDTAGNDGGAAKGIVYVKVMRDSFSPCHVFFSHTQADTNSVEENRTARSKQFGRISEFMTICAGGPPFPEEVFFMGDLNVRGEGAATADPNREWQDYFNRLGSVTSDFAVDVWGRRQCVGAPGLRDPGCTATVRYLPHEQRLDYVVMSTNSGLAAQHVSIDYALAEVPPGIPDVSYLSDHRPLRIDLARPRPNSTPDTAHVATFPPAPAAPSFHDDDQWLMEGQVKWYRFDEPGTYDFWLPQGDDKCGFEVFLDTDLSRPRQQYRKEENPDFGKKFVLASAPFLVKVFPFSRSGEQRYSFRAHKHSGRAWWDAIQLPYGSPVVERFPTGGNVMNDDDPSTDWDDRDTKWFRLDGPQIDMARDLEFTVNITGGGVKFAAALAFESAPNTWDLLDRQGPGADHYTLTGRARKGDRFAVQTTRVDGMAPGDLEVKLVATTNASILLGGTFGNPRLICQKETSGWGADDIELKVTVDGALLRHIDNDEIGDFDQDDVRELNQWVPDLVPYFEGVEFKVIELDDTSPNDIGQTTLALLDDLPAFNRFTVGQVNDDGAIRGRLAIDVDDGTYGAEVSVTTWDERF